MASSPAAASHGNPPFNPSPLTAPASSAPTSKSDPSRSVSSLISLFWRTTSSRFLRRSSVLMGTALASKLSSPTMTRPALNLPVALSASLTPRSCQRGARQMLLS
ncbi:putative oxidoreductase YhdF [Fusarium oxysporum f. sp. albedinis]|nr:putative oxidoreductase YhdF [Fusarium oxysporum f. sp. albedinis]